ncbi:hypothetical protein L1887_36646 [Cichorium endivia]|nr:hypothetical protein L1887_36646 [Cichorium endivia]
MEYVNWFRASSPAIPNPPSKCAALSLYTSWLTAILLPARLRRATKNAFQEHNHTPANDYQVSPSHPSPEWSRLLESLSIACYFNGSSNIEEEFVANEN